MGAGIAKQIKAEFAAAYQADLTTKKGDRQKLGTISAVTIKLPTGYLSVVNAYTQYHWRGADGRADYTAIRNAFAAISQQYKGKRIAYPAIGAGLAGGDWSIIQQIIEEELEGEDHCFVIYSR